MNAEQTQENWKTEKVRNPYSNYNINTKASEIHGPTAETVQNEWMFICSQLGALEMYDNSRRPCH